MAEIWHNALRAVLSTPGYTAAGHQKNPPFPAVETLLLSSSTSECKLVLNLPQLLITLIASKLLQNPVSSLTHHYRKDWVQDCFHKRKKAWLAKPIL